MLLWFEVDDFDAAVVRAQELGAEVELGPVRNPLEAQGAPPTASSGFAILTASPWFWPAPTAKRPDGRAQASFVVDGTASMRSLTMASTSSSSERYVRSHEGMVGISSTKRS